MVPFTRLGTSNRAGMLMNANIYTVSGRSNLVGSVERETVPFKQGIHSTHAICTGRTCRSQRGSVERLLSCVCNNRYVVITLLFESIVRSEMLLTTRKKTREDPRAQHLYDSSAVTL